MPVCNIAYFFYILLRTPPKRPRGDFVASPGSAEVKRPKPQPSYTDPDPFVLPPFNPDDIDGVPVDVEPIKRSSTVFIPSIARPLIRRATDFPMPAMGEQELHVPSPRSAAVILTNVFGLTESSLDSVSVWRKRRDEHKCPLCLDVLVRPVDVSGCGHLVCRTHVIDLYQHGGSKAGIRCPVCRKEDKVEDFNRIQVDQEAWSRIQRAKFHSAKRRSVSPSRSLTPLKDRFNRKFLQDDDF